jgi:hypothetical protein
MIEIFSLTSSTARRILARSSTPSWSASSTISCARSTFERIRFDTAIARKPKGRGATTPGAQRRTRVAALQRRSRPVNQRAFVAQRRPTVAHQIRQRHRRHEQRLVPSHVRWIMRVHPSRNPTSVRLQQVPDPPVCDRHWDTLLHGETVVIGWCIDCAAYGALKTTSPCGHNLESF